MQPTTLATLASINPILQKQEVEMIAVNDGRTDDSL